MLYLETRLLSLKLCAERYEPVPVFRLDTSWSKSHGQTLDRHGLAERFAR